MSGENTSRKAGIIRFATAKNSPDLSAWNLSARPGCLKRIIIPLPPPPPFAGNDFGKVNGIAVHFLACNQIFISYGTCAESHDKEYVKRDFDLFRKSQKLCTPHPVVRSMADYRKHKAKMDAVRKEWARIPQVILPEYIETLKKEGRLPVSEN